MGLGNLWGVSLPGIKVRGLGGVLGLVGGSSGFWVELIFSLCFRQSVVWVREAFRV